MLRTIRLYGELGKKYGKVHNLHVASVSEAIRALSANFKDFKQHIIDSDKRIAGYEVWDGRVNLSEENTESFHLQGADDIKIIPRISGASAGARIIAGVVLMVVGLIITGGTLGAAAPFGTYVFMMGLSVALGGVVALLSSNSTGTTTGNDNENTESYIFSGPVNTTKQGNPVRIGYGKMTVGSQVISASLSTSDIAL